MKIPVLPKTRFGICSAALTLFSVLGFSLLYFLAETSNVITSKAFISAGSVCSLAAALIAAIFGAIGLIRKKDRGVLVFLCVAADAAILLFLAIIMLTGE